MPNASRASNVEAQVLASLNQPNIGAIYGFDDADGVHARALELVEGPTLADGIDGSPPPYPLTIVSLELPILALIPGLGNVAWRLACGLR
jgi:hypothetical protein